MYKAAWLANYREIGRSAVGGTFAVQISHSCGM